MDNQTRFNDASAIATIIFENHSIVKPIMDYFENLIFKSEQILALIELLKEHYPTNNDSDYFGCLRKSLRNIDQDDFDVVARIVIRNGFVLEEYSNKTQSLTIVGSNNTIIQINNMRRFFPNNINITF